MEGRTAVVRRRASTTGGQDGGNRELIAEIERIAAITGYLHRDRTGRRTANHSALAIACGLSRGGFDQIYGGGGTRPETLMALARFAHDQGVPGYDGAQPQARLFRIVGWWNENGTGESGAPLASADDGPAAREAWEIFNRQPEHRQQTMLAILREVESALN